MSLETRRTGTLSYKTSLDDCSAIVGLPERDFVNNRILLDDGSTTDTEAIARRGIVFDDRASTFFTDRLELE